MPCPRRILPLAFVTLPGLLSALPSVQAPAPRTVINPLNLPYRFMIEAPSRREAADPAVIVFKGRYFLFASKSGGYWHSPDLRQWTFVEPTGLPIEGYAPAVVAIGDTLYYMASQTGIYKTIDPLAGRWQLVSEALSVGDPALFADDDGRVFLYHGVSLDGGITGQELDPADDMAPIGVPFACLKSDIARRGWERTGDRNLGATVDGVTRESPWVEGSWMTKHAGRYYLQYAAPGTEFASYADGVVVGDSPRGPFRYGLESPISHRPAGFIAGAGHSTTFADLSGRYWHLSTTVISVTHMFERRLGLFPAAFDAEGVLHVNTVFGDYPQRLPADRGDSVDTFAGWMLLSYRKPVQASSTATNHPAGFAVDENVKTTWSATSARRGEWLQVDLGKPDRVESVQVNFGEEGATAIGRAPDQYHAYLLERSLDGTTWTTLADRRANRTDVPHDYVDLGAPVEARYVRVTIDHVAGGAAISLRDLRVFGHGGGTPPPAPAGVDVLRDADRRNALVRWTRVPGADGYVVRFGTSRSTLYDHYQVYGDTEVSLHSLNVDASYSFAVDAFNDSGWTKGAAVTSVP